jgi:hypothetical protein
MCESKRNQDWVADSEQANYERFYNFPADG